MDDIEFDENLNLTDVMPGKPVWQNHTRGWDGDTLLRDFDQTMDELDELDNKYFEV